MRGVIDMLTKIVEAFDAVGVELIEDNVRSIGYGRGVRLKLAKSPTGGTRLTTHLRQLPADS